MAPNEDGKGNSEHAAQSPTENVDQIREILFGAQMREYDQRFAQLEERLARETSELKADVRRRLDSFEAYTRQEVESLSDRQNTERSERRESLDRISRGLTEATHGLEKRVVQTEEQMSKGLRELRQSMMDHHRNLADELMQCVGKAEALQNRRLEELRAGAMDRLALASLLAEVASRIRGECQVSVPEGTTNAGANQ
jgi:hypothetical protein